MRALHYIALATLPAALLSSCLLPSFENVAAIATAGAGGGNADAGAAAAGEGGVAGEGGAAGATSNGPAPAPVDDVFSMQQGGTLTVPAPGVLGNDKGASLTVSDVTDTDASRPAAYDAAGLSIDADGALEFQPQSEFFGTYSLTYTVRDKDGVSAQASVKINVRPVDAKLATVRDGVGGFVIDGAATDAVGAAVAALGDVNRDGFDDILIGAPTSGANGAGRAYVVYGRAKPAKVTLKTLPAKSSERTFFELDGASGDSAGNAVAGIGDLNGDGAADFAVAASAGDGGLGAVYVVYGGALSGALSLAALPAASGVTLTGSASAPIGALLAGGGDVNGDGLPDLLISGASTNGSVFALLGSDHLTSAVLSSLPNVLKIDGAVSSELLPLSMDFVGTVDADALDEVVMASRSSVTMVLGTPYQYPANTGLVSTDGKSGGWRYTLASQGSTPAVAGAGNVDGDAAQSADVLICEKVGSAFECRVVFGPPVSLDAGWDFSGFTELPRVAHGSDINGDGFSDLLFGDEAHVYVVFGKKSGHAPVDMNALGDAGFTLSAENGGLVDSVTTVGDVNGDGALDYAVGDSSANNGSGSVFVIYGSK
jgi:Bacterial Ig domain/FG-GAP repeat/FG-GAP-like repeat